MSYKVSVLIPCWNIRDYVERVVSSVYCQTYDNIECICIDDGSTDGTYKILEDVVNGFPNRRQIFRLYRRDDNKGLVYTRRQLLDYATGDFIFWLDGDDWLEYNAIELLVQEQRKTNADIVTGLTCNNDNKDDLRFLPSKEYDLDEYKKTLFSSYYNHNVWNRLIRASIIPSDVSTTYGLECGEDWLFMTKVALKARSYVVVRQVTYHYNVSNPNSLYASAKTSMDFYVRNLENYKNMQNITVCLRTDAGYLNIWRNFMLDFLYRYIFVMGLVAKAEDVYDVCFPLFSEFSYEDKKQNLGNINGILLSSPIMMRCIPIYLKAHGVIHRLFWRS